MTVAFAPFASSSIAWENPRWGHGHDHQSASFSGHDRSFSGVFWWSKHSGKELAASKLIKVGHPDMFLTISRCYNFQRSQVNPSLGSDKICSALL